MRRRLGIFLASLFVATAFLSPATTFACTLCDTDTGRQVRAGIFGEHFWSTLAGVIAPFPIMLLAVAAIHFAIPELPKRTTTNQTNPPK